MTRTAEFKTGDHYLREFEALRARTNGGGAWFQPLREEAFERFRELGFPTPKDEDWRYTNVGRIAGTAFTRTADGAGGGGTFGGGAFGGGAFGLTPGDMTPFDLAGVEETRFVFIDGHFAPGLSRAGALPQGVVVKNLARALVEDRAQVEEHLARIAKFEREAFIAMNTAFLEDGAFVFIPRNLVVETPIHLLYLSRGNGAPTVAYPRTLFVLEEGAQATVIEDCASLGDGVAFSNAVTEISAAAGAVATHYLLERENHASYNVSSLVMRQGRSANVTSHSVLLGGALVRNNVHPILAGEGGECLVNGLYLARGEQHMDNYMKVEHASPHCDSRQFYNGILADSGRAVFHGRIIVHKPAQKTDAKQTNKNLLLSGNCQIDTKPQLEIYADDVKCTHGATIGQMDDDAIFYLRARGLPEQEARAMLLLAFAHERLERMEPEPLRRHIARLVDEALPRDTATVPRSSEDTAAVPRSSEE